jgi:two-component system, chemotaxis family, CheB/CheR fusion protein
MKPKPAAMSETSQPIDADRMLRMLFEQTNEYALIMLDPAGKIIGWFPGAETAFGYPPHEALGRNVADLFTPENLAAGMDEYERAVAATDVEAEDDR